MNKNYYYARWPWEQVYHSRRPLVQRGRVQQKIADYAEFVYNCIA